jgi:ABC-type lipoprotein release transport system permease subunit
VRLLLQLAWRNLWRNPRRTGLTAAAGVFAVALSLYTMAIAAGTHERWIEQVIRLYPGHLELSTLGYRENRTLDYGLTLDGDQRRVLDSVPGLEGWTARLEAWALALPDRDDAEGRAAWLLGVDPSQEAELSSLGERLREQNLLTESWRSEVVLGETLARNLGVEPGDSVILLSGDYYGSQSADRFRVVGNFGVGDPRFDGYAVILHIERLRSFVEFPGGISHVAFFSDDGRRAEAIRGQLRMNFVPTDYEVLTWPELIPEVVQFMILDDVGAYVSLSVVILVVAFGLLNTILMSVYERVREFGVMRAVGVRPARIFALVMIESVMVSLIGLSIGYLISVPVLLWLEGNPVPMPGEAVRGMMELYRLDPVMMFRLTATHLWGMAVVLIGVAILAALPPAIRASRGRPVDALHED